MHALRIFYSFVYLIFNERHILGTILGIVDKAVNETKFPLSLHSSMGDEFLDKQTNKCYEGK